MKNVSRGSDKNFCKNYFTLKPAEFYLRGNENLPVKWQEVIKNNGEYAIDWN